MADLASPDRLAVSLDPRPVARRIGLIALATDHTSERDFARICDPDEVGVYVTRVAYENPTTPDSLRRIGPRLTDASRLILPDEPLDVVAFGCTSASVVLGDDAVARAVLAAKPGTDCVTPVSAALDAFRALGVTRLSILTPYTENVTDEVVGYFQSRRLEVRSRLGLGLDDDRKMARISHQTLIREAVSATSHDAEALFVSCTAVRALECVQRIEDRIGKPVVTSNQAMVWRSLRLAGISRSISGFGRLFKL